MAPIVFEIVGFSEILLLCRKIFWLLLLVNVKVANLIGKSLNLAHPSLQVPRRVWRGSIYDGLGRRST